MSSSNHKLILIAEDEEIERSVLVDALEILGYKVKAAENGRQAFDIITSTHVDLLVTDIHMPEMTGLQLLRRLREISIEIPVILLTGYDAYEAQRKAKKYNAEGLLLKPYKMNILNNLIIKALNK